MHKLRIIDLYAGAGGFTLGFCLFNLRQNEVRFVPIWANDNNREAVATYNANFGHHCTEGDISAILTDHNFAIPETDIVIGGPPCQGFSLLNKNRLADPRKYLWQPFMDVVMRSGASVFVMENVPELLASSEYVAIQRSANALGFRLQKAKLIAADYGTPQLRTRAFIMGSRLADPAVEFPPLRTHYDPNAKKGLSLRDYVVDPHPWLTVRDAIGELPAPKGMEITNDTPPFNLHFGRRPTALSIQRYRTIFGEGMNRFDLQRLAPNLTPACWIRKKSGGTDLFGRLWWDRPSVTIRTEFFKPEKGRYLHPRQHRPITHREAARLQGFPDSFIFKGSKIEVARQIGNAVAIQVAEAIASTVADHYLRHCSLITTAPQQSPQLSYVL